MCVNATAVTVIAIDRYIETRRSKFPSSGVYYSTFTRMIVNSVVIWTIGIVFGAPAGYYQDLHPIVVNYSIHQSDGYGYEHDGATTFYTCQEVWKPSVRLIYSIVIFLFQGIVPAMTLVITSRLIVDSVESDRESTENNVVVNNNVSRNVIRDSNISRTLIIISLSFMLFWLPLHVLNTLIDFEIISVQVTTYENIYLITGIVHLIAMSSLPVSAIVYGCLTPSIRRECLICKRYSDNSSDISLDSI